MYKKILMNTLLTSSIACSMDAWKVIDKETQQSSPVRVETTDKTLSDFTERLITEACQIFPKAKTSLNDKMTQEEVSIALRSIPEEHYRIFLEHFAKFAKEHYNLKQEKIADQLGSFILYAAELIQVNSNKDKFLEMHSHGEHDLKWARIHYDHFVNSDLTVDFLLFYLRVKSQTGAYKYSALRESQLLKSFVSVPADKRDQFMSNIVRLRLEMPSDTLSCDICLKLAQRGVSELPDNLFVLIRYLGGEYLSAKKAEEVSFYHFSELVVSLLDFSDEELPQFEEYFWKLLEGQCTESKIQEQELVAKRFLILARYCYALSKVHMANQGDLSRIVYETLPKKFNLLSEASLYLAFAYLDLNDWPHLKGCLREISASSIAQETYVEIAWTLIEAHNSYRDWERRIANESLPEKLKEPVRRDLKKREGSFKYDFLQAFECHASKFNLGAAHGNFYKSLFQTLASLDREQGKRIFERFSPKESYDLSTDNTNRIIDEIIESGK